jgi:hypothetical protein
VSIRSLKNAVRKAIGAIATPDIIIYADLPKVNILPTLNNPNKAE